MDGGPSAGLVNEDGKSDDQGGGGEEAYGHVHVGDGGHTGDGGEDDDEGGDDVFAEVCADGVGEDEVEDVAAADELVAGDGSVGKEDGDDAEDAGSLTVAGFEEVGDGVLGEFACARGDEVDEQKPGPSATALPEGYEAVFVGVLGTTEEGAGADPAGEQGEDEDEGGQGATGDEIVGLRLDLAETGEGDREEGQDDDGQNGGVEIHVVVRFYLVGRIVVFTGGFGEIWCLDVVFLWLACGGLRGEGGLRKDAFLRLWILQIFGVYFEALFRMTMEKGLWSRWMD